MILDALFVATSIWILFFGGAEKLENSFLGYLGFGRYGDKFDFIKGLTWAALALFIAHKLLA